VTHVRSAKTRYVDCNKHVSSLPLVMLALVFI